MATLETQPPVRIGRMQTVIDAVRVAQFIVNEQLKIRPGEEVMIACDTMTEMEILHSLAGAIQAAGAEFTICMQPSRAPKDAAKLNKVVQKQPVQRMSISLGATLVGQHSTPREKRKRVRGFSLLL